MQKKQIEWKFEFFCHWWRIEKQIITKIKKTISKNLKNKLNVSFELYKNNCFFEKCELHDFDNDCVYDYIWIVRNKWINNHMNERNITKHFYFSFFTIIRNNDIEKMRIHMKKKYTFERKSKFWNNRLNIIYMTKFKNVFVFIIENRIINLSIWIQLWNCFQIKIHLIQNQLIQIIEFDIICFIVLSF